MKTILLGGAIAVAAIGVVIWEESRIASLQEEIAALKGEALSPGEATAKQGASLASGTGSGVSPKSDRTKTAGAETEPDDRDPNRAKGDQALGETIRKIFENQAGLAMINEEHKGRAARLYGALIDDLNLTKEEEEYFINILAPGVAEQDMTGMKLFNAKSDEERLQIMDDMETAQKERRKAVADFLNSDEDFAKYETYQARKSEYEQLPGIRAVMEQAGVPMKADQEAALVEAMFDARTETGISERWEGRAGFMQYAEPGVSERFEKDWAQMQTALDQRTEGLLDEAQHKAFDQQQEQVKGFITMGIRMVESMTQSGQQ